MRAVDTVVHLESPVVPASPAPPLPAPTFMDRTEIARELRMCVRQVDRLVKQRKIPCIKLGRRTLFQWDKVMKALQAYEQREIQPDFGDLLT